MPANLPPQYYELEREFKSETDPGEKLRLAQELLRMMPKHKGTSKLQADMKSKISQLRKELDAGSPQHGARTAAAHDHIPREGAGQVILIGSPNCGKSSLIDALTNAEPLIADYAYTTREPMVAMMEFETIHVQLIDTPAISEDQFDGYLSSLIRNADIVALVADLSDEDMRKNTEIVLSRLEERRILLRSSTDEEPEDPRFAVKRSIVIGHKEYDDESGERLSELESIFPGYELIPTSILDDDSLEKLRTTLYRVLRVVRVYTKHVGKEVELVDPVILPIGGTVLDAAEAIHKDFAQKLKFARIWGEGKIEGQRVQRDYVLHDEDIVEFHV